VSALARAARLSFGDYSPAAVVEAVEELRAAGRDEALARLEAAIQDAPPPPDATGLLWVMRVLFDVPADVGFPPVLLGEPDVPPPPDPGALPRFPIAIFRDVPFLVVRGYALGGLPEPVEAHTAYYREHGTIAADPLAPVVSLDLERDFLRAWPALYAPDEAPDVSDLIGAQVRRLTTAP
jgi:hypothetical protein